jgi:hypothetical protein
LDETFVIQRDLLDMVQMKQTQCGAYIAKLFQEIMDLYEIRKDMVGGVTQDNASNCGTCTDFLVDQGYETGCFLHIPVKQL